MSTQEQYSVVVRKDCRNNWKAESVITLSKDAAGEGLELHVNTHKVFSGSLVTTATVHHVEEGRLTHMVYQDYSQRLKACSVRCTEKAVRAQHEEVLRDMLAAVLVVVRTQYNLTGLARPVSAELSAKIGGA